LLRLKDPGTQARAQDRVRITVPLRISERQSEGIDIFSLSGRLVLGVEAATFQDALDRVTNSGLKWLLLDLAQLSFIDSTGLGTLVAAYSRLKLAGGAVKLLHVSKKHVELLILTKLTTIFEIYDDEPEAIDSFFPDRARKRFDILQFVQSQPKDEPEKPG
jgi:anti-sigma B factor antagonist